MGRGEQMSLTRAGKPSLPSGRGWKAVACGLLSALAVSVASAQNDFRFSDDAAKEGEEQAARISRVQALVSVPCQARVKRQKILLLLAERSQESLRADQARYQGLIEAIDIRLQALGLITYTKEQIKKQIAQAEIDAYFKNDPDAALAASRRLAARYVLSGEIVTQTHVNAPLQIPEVAVDLSFTLAESSGRKLSHVSSHTESYSGADTLAMARTLVNEQADDLVATLYRDYCTAAGTP
jgi:hypothetical protein